MYHCFLTNFESVISWYFMSQFSKHSKNYTKFDLQYQSTATFKDTKSPLPKITEHRMDKEYQGSDNRGKLDIKSDVDRPASVKLRQYTTVSSQCERLYYP